MVCCLPSGIEEHMFIATILSLLKQWIVIGSVVVGVLLLVQLAVVAFGTFWGI